MKFGVVNKSTILNRFVLHTLQRNFQHLAVITRKTKIKLVTLKEGKLEKSQGFLEGRTDFQKKNQKFCRPFVFWADQIHFSSSPKALFCPYFGQIFCGAGKKTGRKRRF